MSILLDALKKSEAQRQLGETPTIHSTSESFSTEAPAVKSWLIALMLLSVAVVIAFYVTEQFDEPDLSILGYSEMAPAPAAKSEAAQETRDEQASQGDVRTPVESFKPQISVKQSDTSQQQKSRLSESVSSYKPPVQSPASSERQSARSASRTQGSNQTASISSSGLTRGNDRQPSAQPATAETSEITEPSMLTYWQLPQAVRDNISQLKISVLVYAANPEDRFILMEGKRLREGDEAGGGLNLEEIRRDGAVFTYRRYTFLLPN